jgi:hypothetical protein
MVIDSRFRFYIPGPDILRVVNETETLHFLFQQQSTPINHENWEIENFKGHVLFDHATCLGEKNKKCYCKDIFKDEIL